MISQIIVLMIILQNTTYFQYNKQSTDRIKPILIAYN